MPLDVESSFTSQWLHSPLFSLGVAVPVLAMAHEIFDLHCSMQDLWLQHRDSSSCGIWDLVP